MRAHIRRLATQAEKNIKRTDSPYKSIIDSKSSEKFMFKQIQSQSDINFFKYDMDSRTANDISEEPISEVPREIKRWRKKSKRKIEK